jgi:magnesium transporter
MRLLTIFTAILLPLGLIAEIYGMNGIDLANITEMPRGFFIALVTVAFIVIRLVLFFVKKRWIVFGKQNPDSAPVPSWKKWHNLNIWDRNQN